MHILHQDNMFSSWKLPTTYYNPAADDSKRPWNLIRIMISYFLVSLMGKNMFPLDVQYIYIYIIYIVILCYTIIYKGFGPNRKSVSVQPSIFAAQWSWANVLKCILEYWSVLACFSDQTLGIEQHTGPPLNHWRLNRPWGYNMIQPILVDRYSMVFVWWHQIIPRIASPTSTLAAGTSSKVEPCCPDGSPASGNMR